MTIDGNKIIVEGNAPIEYLDRDLEQLDLVSLWGIVRSVKDGTVKVEILDVRVQAEKFSTSSSVSNHHHLIELDIA